MNKVAKCFRAKGKYLGFVLFFNWRKKVYILVKKTNKLKKSVGMWNLNSWNKIVTPSETNLLVKLQKIRDLNQYPVNNFS